MFGLDLSLGATSTWVVSEAKERSPIQWVQREAVARGTEETQKPGHLGGHSKEVVTSDPVECMQVKRGPSSRLLLAARLMGTMMGVALGVRRGTGCGRGCGRVLPCQRDEARSSGRRPRKHEGLTGAPKGKARYLCERGAYLRRTANTAGWLWG